MSAYLPCVIQYWTSVQSFSRVADDKCFTFSRQIAIGRVGNFGNILRADEVLLYFGSIMKVSWLFHFEQSIKAPSKLISLTPGVEAPRPVCRLFARLWPGAPAAPLQRFGPELQQASGVSPVQPIDKSGAPCKGRHLTQCPRTVCAVVCT